MRLLRFLPNEDIATLVMSFLPGGKDHFKLVAEYRTLLLWHDYLNSDWHHAAHSAISWANWRRCLIGRGHDWLETCNTKPGACSLRRLPPRFCMLQGEEDSLREAAQTARMYHPVERETRACCSQNCINQIPVFRDDGAILVSDALLLMLYRARRRIHAATD